MRACPARQLNIPLEQPDNPLAKRLKHAQFCVLVEFDTPLREQPFDSAVTLGRRLAKAAAAADCVAAITVTDRLRGEDTHDPAHVAEALQAAGDLPVVMHMSGKGSDRQRIRQLVAHARSAGVQNMLAVTGDRSDKHPQGGRRSGRTPPHPVGYADSLAIIDEARRNHPEMLIGAGVNPFKYNPADAYLQLYKMVRKIGSGADFIVTQAGWDMKKLQELKWYMQMRELELPIVARLPLLGRDEIRGLHHGFVPGVPISREFAALLQRESDISDAQSMAAQLRRLSLQAAGCRFLGYSAVQITGVHSEQTLNMVLKAVAEPPAGVSTYADWVEAWNDYHGSTDFAPAPGAYYMFRDLLDVRCQMYDETQCTLTERRFPKPARGDAFKSRLLGLLEHDWIPDRLADVLRAPVCRHCASHAGDTEWCFHLCPSACPKRLTCGACGGSQYDGHCEFGHDRCFFHRVLALAAQRHELTRLEEPVHTHD